MTEREWLISDNPEQMLHCLTTGFSSLPPGETSERMRHVFPKLSLRKSWFFVCASRNLKGLGIPDSLPINVNEKDTLSAAMWAACSCDFQHRPHIASFLRDIAGNPFRPLPTIQECWLRWNDGAVRRLAEAIYEEDRWEDCPILADALEDAGCNDEEILKHLRGWQRCFYCLGNPTDLPCGQECPCVMPGPHGGSCRDGNGWLKGTGKHVRGCWALDLLLGRE